MDTERYVLEIVGTLQAAGRPARSTDCGEKQSNEDQQNKYDREQIPNRETSSMSTRFAIQRPTGVNA
jgi:hypothetical protein